MKILTIIGARPQFIKAVTVSREIAKYDDIKEIIVHTGQHYDFNMSDIFFEEMRLPKPDYFLGIGNKSHGEMTGGMIIRIEKILLKEKPGIVMVYGDTNSTLAGTIAASKLYIPIAHVEAGLRSFNMQMPEEINRILTDRVSKWLFCPTDVAVNNLKKEGYPNKLSSNNYQKIIKVGDVMYDGVLFYKRFARKPQIDIKGSFILCTIHRAENTDNLERLKNIFEALNEIGKEKQVILPLHPRTEEILNHLSLNISHLILINPVGYLEMVWLLDNCNLVITDSGGLQKEAYFFKKPCITLRDETEWTELVENGFNILAGADKEKILNVCKNYRTLFSNNNQLNLYGNGKASEGIVRELIR